ncbi:MAG: hypothetical protein COA38_01075 [Fluviicola sp.]|nr:MAG: hypothetical protein COA38_01075 [Fluviicola sp.]
MKNLKTIGFTLILIFVTISTVNSQVQLSFQGNNVPSGSSNQFNATAYNTDQSFTIDILNTSSIVKNYTVTRTKLINPASWTIIKSVWENPNTIDVYCYPSSSDVVWTTFNQIATSPNTSIYFEDVVQVSNDSCAHYRYYINSAEDGIEDSLDVIFCKVVGVEEISNIDLAMYPNPVSEVLTIESSVLIEKVRMYDSNGKMISSMLTKSQFVTIPIAGLQNGVYFVHLETTSGLIEKRRFVVSTESN